MRMVGGTLAFLIHLLLTRVWKESEITKSSPNTTRCPVVYPQTAQAVQPQVSAHGFHLPSQTYSIDLLIKRKR